MRATNKTTLMNRRLPNGGFITTTEKLADSSEGADGLMAYRVEVDVALNSIYKQPIKA